MSYKLTKSAEVLKKEKFGINLEVHNDFGDCGFVVVETETGHNQEFYNVRSTFHYIILEGGGCFFLDDKEVLVEKGDSLSISPKTRIYYKGKMRLALITNPPWGEEDEMETKAQIW